MHGCDGRGQRLSEDDFETAFAAWLREEAGVEEPRRIVRRDGTRILVSKFDEGFAPRLFESLTRVPELLDDAVMRRAYDAASGDAGGTRVGAWREAASNVLGALAPGRGLGPAQVAEVQAGVDSVAALLDAALWTAPAPGGKYTPLPAEVAAMAEALAKLEGPSSMFTRHYGTFRGARVENHCPGAHAARALLAQAWNLCTGLALPDTPEPLATE